MPIPSRRTKESDMRTTFRSQTTFATSPTRRKARASGRICWPLAILLALVLATSGFPAFAYGTSLDGSVDTSGNSNDGSNGDVASDTSDGTAIEGSTGAGDTTDGEARVGSLTLVPETEMVGGVIAIYKVAAVNRDEDDPFYDYTMGQFVDSEINAELLADISDMDKETLDKKNAGMAASLEAEAARSNMEPYAKKNIENNTVSFQNLQEGLYLVCQPELSEGDRTIHSFLMSIPGVDGELDVVSKPKPSNSVSPWRKDKTDASDGNKDATGNNSNTSNTNRTTTGGTTGGGSGGGGGSNISLRVPQTGDRTTSVALIALLGFSILMMGAIIGRTRGGRAVGAHNADASSGSGTHRHGRNA